MTSSSFSATGETGPTGERPRGVGDPAVEDDADVDRDDVAALEAVRPGDAVHDHRVRRGADRAREAAVALERRASRPASGCTSRPRGRGRAVVTPSRTLPSSILSVRTRMAPAAAILSISSVVLRMITSPYRVRAPARVRSVRCWSSMRSVWIVARRWSCTSVGLRVPSKRCSRSRLVVVLDERRRLLAVDLLALADRLLAVVVALRRAARRRRRRPRRAWAGCARRGTCGRSGTRGGPRAAGRAPPRGTSMSSTARQRAVDLLQRLVERLGLRVGAREAVEQEAVARCPARDRRSRITPMITSSGTRSPLSMYSLASLPRSVPSLTACAQDVAGRDVGEREVLLQALGLGALARARGSQQDEVELGHAMRSGRGRRR